ncbi:helix-turn-helix transcriptional regulator [Luteolibacter flavescens]|uniref:Helix-turn-helix transcriptional regulator n=1 Tax=Luteolibacter flavescens TaxID=1859460 RepID=A0ABT3FIE2_9BACT|nr:helix-turn-helix transcriptional regulator [Luteolibacter flavescens]MCW1883328.1 helix-turn-helix transcriptional regulator [Luteolibacter flavescens]
MLGTSYFELAQAIYKATNFDDVVDLLVAKLPSLIGTEEAVISGTSPIAGVCSVFGHGPMKKLVQERTEVMNRLIGSHPIMNRVDFNNPGDLGFAMSDYVSPEEYRNAEFTRQVYGDKVSADVMFGLLVAGVRRKAYLTCYFSTEGLSVQARERFDAILLTVRGVLDRLEAYNVERAVRQRVFGASAPLAIFFLNQSSEVCPLNHAAVTFAESHWLPDEAVRQLTPDQTSKIDLVVDGAWINPVTADWRDVTLDLGAGASTIHALPKLSGEVILMIPIAGKDPNAEEAVTILTRRQREIMDWIAEGKTSAEAAIILGISPRTVEKHLEAVFQRLGVENRIAAMRRYLDLKRGI